MAHETIKRILITRVTELIASNYKITIDEARDRLYSSRLVDLINDDETGLYGESALYSFSVFESIENR